MQISCKCLNFIASSNSQSSNTAPTNAATTADEECTANAGCNNSGGNNLSVALMQAFLQKYPRNFIFYSQCMDFFKQTIGPVSDLTINALSQRNLVYSLTLDIAHAQILQSWQLSICINCNVALCAKRLPAAGAPPTTPVPPQFLINCSLLTNNEELGHRRASKSYSDTFGLLIMDRPDTHGQQEQSNKSSNASASSMNFTVGSLSSASNLTLDVKQQRLRQLQQYLQQRLQREIIETEERIERYTEQQFALLKSFREKAEQECAQLVQLIQRVPDQQANELLDRTPPALDVNGSIGSRRRNTIGSWRDINATTPTTPTSVMPNAAVSGFLALPLNSNATTATSVIDTNTQGAQTVLPATIAASSNVNRKMSNFDTPPATPEATPMSVGNSPTFRQQQQQQLPQPFVRIAANSFQQQFPTPTADPVDDCLFELEGVDSVSAPPTSYNPLVSNLVMKLPYQQHLQRSISHQHHHQQHEKNMSDLDESDDAEEAEVALDLDSSIPIPTRNREGRTGAAAPPADIMNFAKSLPIEIANSPMAQQRAYAIEESADDELDNMDIAASMKALAKSVHGEAVFGDLPRPRLRSQI